MDNCAHKLLESATHKTLHAHAFSRASTQATVVLTDLLARYLTLLTSTCAKYAQHSGRSKLTIYDALEALKELGTSEEDLEQYGSGEGRELNRYALHSARRQEELNEFRLQLLEGLKQDRDDYVPLAYARYDEDIPFSDDEDEEQDAMDVDGVPQKRRQATPPLPFHDSPSPSGKRLRTANWLPPEHVPDFLPPFPSSEISPQHVPIPDSVHPSPRLSQLLDLPIQPLQVPQTLTTTTTTFASDILVQVPYSQSSLASLPERHLPGPAPPAPPTSSRALVSHRTATTSTPTSNSAPNPLPQIGSSFIAAYHYILTHPAPTTPPPSTLQRHRVAMSLLDLIQNNSRWTPSDSLYGSIAPCPPRLATAPPSFPVAISDLAPDGKPKEPTAGASSFKFPQTNSRPVATVERLAALVGQPSSRLPDLARHVLHPAILNRSTRLIHPPVLQRGSKPLAYGPGIPAPWNSNPVPPPDTGGVPQTPLASKPKEEETSKAIIPDALLFATWDYDTKDYRVPLPRHRTRMGSVAGGNTITLPHLTRKGTK